MPSTLPLADRLAAASHRASLAWAERIEARVASVAGARATLGGLAGLIAPGDRVLLIARDGSAVPAEVTGTSASEATLMLYRQADGLGTGARAVLPLAPESGRIGVSDAWIGRVIDPLGVPLDEAGPLPPGSSVKLRRPPPPAARRARLGPAVRLGVRAMDVFTACREGQRLGLFAGAGVGKSTLMGMLARWSDFDTIVVGLVGERGREVREFIEDDLGPHGMRRSVVVVATSDSTALMRRDAVYAAMAAAEHFRDQGQRVLLLVDSLTRFCHAAREVALSTGELPVARGYPPSVFAELASLLERAGPGTEGCRGSITAFFTVLVDGDDPNEPVADAARGILDGHVILSRRIAERGRYPAIDILRSLSRTAAALHDQAQTALLRQARLVMTEAEELEELVRLGVVRSGADPAHDRTLALNRALVDFLRQPIDDPADPQASFATLAQLLHASAS